MTSTNPETGARGALSASISNRIVSVLHRYTGRGPTRARTTLGTDIVVCVTGDTLTKGEQTLVRGGRQEVVLDGRRAFQDTMKDELIDSVQSLTGRNVVAFMSTNHIDPDLGVEVFILESAGDGLPYPGDGTDGASAIDGADGAAATDGGRGAHDGNA